MNDIIKALELINDFCIQEYGNEHGRYTSEDIKDIGIGYTTLTDEEIPVSVVVDLEAWKLKVYFADCWKVGTMADIEKNITLADLEEIDFSWVTDQEEYLEEHLEELLFYWIKEYDYTLEANFDGGYWLHDNQEVNEDRAMTKIEVIDYFLESLKEKNDIVKEIDENAFDHDIKELEEYKRLLIQEEKV